VDDKRRLILDQALALVDEHGLEAVSMRAVAQRVGLTSMALYPYVGGKDALLDGLVDLLRLELGERFGADPQDWRHRLRAIARAVRALARAHPGAYPLLVTRPTAAAPTALLAAALRAALHDAGVPAGQVDRLAGLWSAYLVGWTATEVTGTMPQPPADPDADFEADLGDLLALVETAAGAARVDRPVRA
jgi:AcrR family transcriptional regulator